MTQTLPTGNSPDTIAVPTAASSPSSPRPRRSRRIRGAAAAAVVAAVALIAFGVTSQVRGEDAPTVVPQRADEASLLLAAESARQMEILTPQLSRVSPRPASYTDLRLAAEWARRLEFLSKA